MVTVPLSGDVRTLGAALAAAAEQFGDREAYVDGRVRLTYTQWITRARGLAGLLVRRGVRPGDVVAIMLGPGVDYAVSYAATAWVGAVATGLNTRLGPREVAAILQRADPAVVIRDADAGLPEVKGYQVVSRAELDGLDGGPASPVEVDPHDPAVIIWTSGTTGLPKGAWFDHRNLASAATTAGVMSAPGDRRLMGLPFAHAGYMAKLWDQIAWGTTIVLSPTPWSAASMAGVLRDERITVAGAVPTQWAKLLQEAQQRQLGGLQSVRIGVAATAPASGELVRSVGELLGVPLVVRYAMTEAPSICGTEIDDPPDVQATTVGRPQAGMEVRIVDGVIQVRGPSVMRGYWKEPEQTERVFDEGWLITGDHGRMTSDGDLVLLGRVDDTYIRGGYKVHPLEVENVLAEHPGIAAAAVIGVPAEVIGEKGVAVVVPVDGAAQLSLQGIRAWVADRLADYKRPDELVLAESLPLTSMLKVDRAALRESVS